MRRAVGSLNRGCNCVKGGAEEGGKIGCEGMGGPAREDPGGRPRGLGVVARFLLTVVVLVTAAAVPVVGVVVVTVAGFFDEVGVGVTELFTGTDGIW